MLLSAHVNSALFLVRVNNFALTTGVTRSYSSHHSYALLLINITALLSRPLTGSTGVTASKFDCACKSHNLEIAHVLRKQDSESAQRNLEITQILRLH